MGFAKKHLKNYFLESQPKKYGEHIVMWGEDPNCWLETGLSGESLRRCELDVGLSW